MRPLSHWTDPVSRFCAERALTIVHFAPFGLTVWRHLRANIPLCQGTTLLPRMQAFCERISGTDGPISMCRHTPLDRRLWVHPIVVVEISRRELLHELAELLSDSVNRQPAEQLG